MKRFTTALLPNELAGVKKRSFKMPFGGAEIWFEHLDGMYQYTEIALKKLENDSVEFLRPSFPALFAVILNETLPADELTTGIARFLTCGKKRFCRVAFIGAARSVQKHLRLLLTHSGFALAFFDDLEAAKRWLVSAD